MGHVARIVRIVVSARGHGDAVRELADLRQAEAEGEIGPDPEEEQDLKRQALSPDRDPELRDVPVEPVYDCGEVHALSPLATSVREER